MKQLLYAALLSPALVSCTSEAPPPDEDTQGRDREFEQRLAQIQQFVKQLPHQEYINSIPVETEVIAGKQIQGFPSQQKDMLCSTTELDEFTFSGTITRMGTQFAAKSQGIEFVIMDRNVASQLDHSPSYMNIESANKRLTVHFSVQESPAILTHYKQGDSVRVVKPADDIACAFRYQGSDHNTHVPGTSQPLRYTINGRENKSLLIKYDIPPMTDWTGDQRERWTQATMHYLENPYRRHVSTKIDGPLHLGKNDITLLK